MALTPTSRVSLARDEATGLWGITDRAAGGFGVEERGGVLGIDTLANAGNRAARASGVVSLHGGLPDLPDPLLSWRVGQGGYAASRDSTAHQCMPSGVLRSVAAGALRDLDYVLRGGAHERIARLEGRRTNVVPRSEPTRAQLSRRTPGVADAAFSEAGLSGGLHIPGGTGTTEYAYQSVPVSATTLYTASFYVIMDDGGAPVLGADSASGDFGVVGGGAVVSAAATVARQSGSLYRVSLSFITPARPGADFGIVRYTTTSHRGFRFAGWQLEEASFVSSYIRTTGSSATRSTDVLRVPLVRSAPRELTFYVRLIAGATTPAGYLAAIGRTSSDGVGLALYAAAGGYRWTHCNGSTVVNSIPSDSSLIAPGDLVEYNGVLYGDGSVQAWLSLNGGAASAGLRSGAAPLASAWATPWVYVGGNSGGSGAFGGFTHAQMEAGVLSLAEMRSRANVY